MQQRTPEWFLARLGKVTASSIADVMAEGKGGGPSASRANYMAQLAAERLTGVVNESYSSRAIQHGIDTEAEALSAYQMTEGVTVTAVGFVQHPHIAMAGASPDGLCDDSGLVEIKCPNTATHISTLTGGSIDGRYIKQMQWQMACTDRQWCDFVSYDPRLPGSLKLHVERVSRDDAMIEKMEQAAVTFLAELDTMVEDLKRIGRIK